MRAADKVEESRSRANTEEEGRWKGRGTEG